MERRSIERQWRLLAELAEENRRKSGLTNVEFLKGEIENIPLSDNSVDVIISNCVIRSMECLRTYARKM